MPTKKKSTASGSRAASSSKRTGVRKKVSKTTSKSPQAKSKVKKVMREYKEGELRSGRKSGPKVKSRKQAIAIALSEAGVSKKRSSKKKAGQKR
jgi:hypothetical protein